MTGPLLLPDPGGPYEASFSETDPDAQPFGSEFARFRRPWMAREWLQHRLIVTDQFDPGSRRYRATITAGAEERTLYDLRGSAPDIAFRLTLLGRNGIDATRVTGQNPLTVVAADELAREYRACVDEWKSAYDADPTSSRTRGLHEVRAGIRREIHAVALNSAPLSQPAHLLLAQVLLEIDTEALAQPHGRYGAVCQWVDLEMHAGSTAPSRQPRASQFDSASHAQEWLISQLAISAFAADPTDPTVELHGTVFDLERVRFVRAEIGSPAATGLRLASAEHEPDGIVTTGIPDVDHHELNRLVEAYEKVTDFLINATNRVRSDDEARLPTDRLDHIIIPRTDIGGQIVALAATAGTDDAEVALRRLWAADQRVINDRDLVSAHTTVPTSGFVLADIQVALAQMARLTALDSATSPQITETSHKIAEVRDRIRQLMDADNFRPENRSIIDAHITQILVNQDHQQAGLYAWPSVSALDSRTRRLTAVRTQPGHRGFSDALRLHHLTQAIHLDGLIPADPHRDLVLDALLSRQRDYLWTAIETDTSLSTATAAALTGIMQYDPATPIPNHHVVTPLRAHPADGPPTPDTTAVPGQPYRILLPRGEHEWYLGIENGRWTARVHQLYPAFPTLRREIGAAHYDSAEQMLDAVTTEPTVLAPEGREVILAPLDIPEPVRTALYRAQELCERPSSPAATTGHKVTPSAAPAPHSADKRHPTRRQPPPPPPPPRRRI